MWNRNIYLGPQTLHSKLLDLHSTGVSHNVIQQYLV